MQYQMNSANYAPRPNGSQAYGYGQEGAFEPKNGYSMDYGNKQLKLEAVKPKWNDLVFALLFIAQFGGFCALAGLSLKSLAVSNKTSGVGAFGGAGGTSLTLNSQTAYLLGIISATALGLSLCMLALVRMFTTVILEVTLFLSVAVTVAYAVFLYLDKNFGAAIMMTIIAVFSIIAYFPMRRRIPFSRQLLLFVLRIAKEYPSVYVIALLGAVVQSAYSVFWSFTTVAIYQQYANNSPKQTGLLVYSVFSFYWTSQFILNYFLVIEAGIFGSFYFSGGKQQDGSGPKRVAWGAAKRASTYSLGSIAFGSLVVAILDLLKFGFQVFQSSEANSGDIVGAAILCVVGCCLNCITGLVEYFNRYAFIEIALYGKSYIKAAKDTWNLFRDRGIDALVSDSLINSIWTFGSLIVGALSSAFAYIYLRLDNPSYVVANPGIKSAVIGYAFIIGFVISHTLGYGALSSGASTNFVGLAEDPQALAERDPRLFEVIRQTYPKVVTPV